MKTLILLLLVSSLPSLPADGLTIGNSFRVDKEAQIYRGKEPKKLVGELLNLGITDVLIFKNEVKTEVTDEIADLESLGIHSHHVPFRWKNYPSMQEACEQVVEAIDIIHSTKNNGEKIFFHCTAGEDRTGMLAGIYRMLEEKKSMEYVFKNEMCARGYSDGNYRKPPVVWTSIQKELTPLFVALAGKVQDGSWKLGKITKESCQGIEIKPTKLKCRGI